MDSNEYQALMQHIDFALSRQSRHIEAITEILRLQISTMLYERLGTGSESLRSIIDDLRRELDRKLDELRWKQK
ncbi:hypothetical protein ACHMW6_29150 [Pseudoduganella sp. UC29_106]|uniref:hypothetical protein n=1 Tax=Pseudoduganella sp. UC29_106 TaxID=3374553 RepID=UPI003757374B